MFNNGDIYEKNENGKVFCGKNIMLSIINLAAKEISGVASLCTNFGSKFKKFFSAFIHRNKLYFYHTTMKYTPCG